MVVDEWLQREIAASMDSTVLDEGVAVGVDVAVVVVVVAAAAALAVTETVVAVASVLPSAVEDAPGKQLWLP